MIEKYQKIIKYYGQDNQLNKLVEEMGEFLAELSRNRNGDLNRGKLLEELEDVKICLRQFELMYNVDPFEQAHIRNFKLDRQCQRIDKEILNVNSGHVWK